MSILLPVFGFAAYGSLLWIYKEYTFTQARLRIVCSTDKSLRALSLDEFETRMMSRVFFINPNVTMSYYVPSKERYDELLKMFQEKMTRVDEVRIEMLWQKGETVCSDCFDLVATGQKRPLL